MAFKSLEPFIPSGSDFEGSKQLFLALGFQINWLAGGYIGFQRDACKFILLNYEDRAFSENLMMRVVVSNLDQFWHEILYKELEKIKGVRFKKPTQYLHGREVHLIDLAGVCWHFAGE
jgi:hypothetical protein